VKRVRYEATKTMSFLRSSSIPRPSVTFGNKFFFYCKLLPHPSTPQAGGPVRDCLVNTFQLSFISGITGCSRKVVLELLQMSTFTINMSKQPLEFY